LECASKVYKKNPCCPFCRRPFELPLPPVNKEIVQLVVDYVKSQEVKNERMEESAPPQESDFFQLPDEVLIDILSFLPPRDIGKSSRVCRDFQRLADDSWLWRDICQNLFPFCSVDKYGKNWKWCYVARSQLKYGWDEGKASQFEVTTFRGHTNYVNCFQLYRNNIVSGSADHKLKIWKVDNAEASSTLVGHNGVVNCLNFNEVKIVSGASDSTVRIWDTKTGIPIKSIAHTGAVHTLQFDDSKIISGGDGRTILVSDVRDGSTTLRLDGHNSSVFKLTFDNNNVISGGQDGIKVWDLRTGNLLRNLSSAAPSTFQVAGNQAIVGYNDGQLQIIDVATAAVSSFNGPRHYARINDVQTDGKNVATAAADGTIKYWDLTHKKLLHSLEEHKSAVNSIKFSNNKLVSASADNSLKVWDLKKGTRLYTLLGGSLQKRANNPDHPTRQGCSFMDYDDSRIIASFASLLRVYDFEVYKPNK